MDTLGHLYGHLTKGLRAGPVASKIILDRLGFEGGLVTITRALSRTAKAHMVKFGVGVALPYVDC